MNISAFHDLRCATVLSWQDLCLSLPRGFDELSVEDKIEYLNSLWDRIAVELEAVPVPDWHRQILDERLARDEAHPEEGLPWEEVRQEILRDLRSSAGKR